MSTAIVQFIDKEQLTTIQDYAKYLADGRALPAGIDNAAKLAMILHAGKDLGLSATQALSGITLVNGKPVVWGSVAASLMTANGYKLEWLEATATKARLKISKDGRGDHTEEFTIDDAKKAGLASKPGPWTLYPKDMLRWKALARARNFFCPEVGAGMPLAEDYRDSEDVVPEGPSELQQQVEATETLEELAKFAGKVHSDKPAYEAYVKQKKKLSANIACNPKEEVVEAKVEEVVVPKEPVVTVEPVKKEPAKAPVLSIKGNETLTAARDAERTSKKRAKATVIDAIGREWIRDDLPEETKKKRTQEQMAKVLDFVADRKVANLYDLTPTEAEIILSAIIWQNNQAIKGA